MNHLEDCISVEEDDRITAEEDAKTDIVILQEIVVALQNQIFKLRDRVEVLEKELAR